MPRCPLCSDRAAKRYCPSKAESICAGCCGTHREVDIDCPASCSFLKAAQVFDETKPLDPQFRAKARQFNAAFVQEYQVIVDLVIQTLVDERQNKPWLVDNDAIEALKALSKTFETLDKGIYYESVPEGPARAGLFRSLKATLDPLMTPAAGAPGRILKISEALKVLDFIAWTAAMNTNGRPRCRRFLDWVSESSGPQTPAPEPSRLILP